MLTETPSFLPKGRLSGGDAAKQILSCPQAKTPSRNVWVWLCLLFYGAVSRPYQDAALDSRRAKGTVHRQESGAYTPLRPDP